MYFKRLVCLVCILCVLSCVSLCVSGEQRDEAKIVGLYDLSRKIMAAVGFAVVLPAIDAAGYKPCVVPQKAAAKTAIRVCYALVPAILGTVAVVVLLLFYRLDRARHAEVLDELRRQGNSQGNSQGGKGGSVGSGGSEGDEGKECDEGKGNTLIEMGTTTTTGGGGGGGDGGGSGIGGAMEDGSTVVTVVGEERSKEV